MPFRISRGVYGHGSPSTAMSHCSTAIPGRHGTSVYDAGSGTAIMSGSAGLWPIGPAANPAKPAPPSSTSIAVTGIILAHGLPCMSTNMAKKNSTPSDSALARSSPSTSDIGAPSHSWRSVTGRGPRRVHQVLLTGLIHGVKNGSRGFVYKHESGRRSLGRHDG